MRIRYCPKCNKAGLKWKDPEGKGFDRLTDKERYEAYRSGKPPSLERWNMRYCPRCQEWVKANIGIDLDQHKVRRY